MNERAARRPPWALLSAGLGLLTIGAVRLTRPHDAFDVGGFSVVWGVTAISVYVDRALRWLKDHRKDV